jgi:hypothetical protein
MKKHLFIAVLGLSVIISCTKGTENNSSAIACTGTKSFAADVNPIFQNVCANSGCHDASSTNGPGALTTYQQIFNARSNIRTAIANGTMPKNASLSADQKSAIICWIDGGATNN